MCRSKKENIRDLKMESYKSPTEMSFNSGSVAGNWKKWFQKFKTYMCATEKDAKPDVTKIAILLNLIRDEGVEVHTFKFEIDEKYDYVVKKLEERHEKMWYFNGSNFLSVLREKVNR